MNKNTKEKLSNAEATKHTKRCIARAILELMDEMPLEKITVTSIIKRSGVSRATFYRHYSSKEDVIREMDESIARRIREVRSRKQYQEDKYSFLVRGLTIIKRYNSLQKILFDPSSSTEQTFQTMMETVYSVKNQTEEFYNRVAYAGAVTSVIKAWISSGLNEPPEEIANYIRNNFPHMFEGEKK